MANSEAKLATLVQKHYLSLGCSSISTTFAYRQSAELSIEEIFCGDGDSKLHFSQICFIFIFFLRKFVAMLRFLPFLGFQLFLLPFFSLLP